jgi:tRNA G46 methylase TrmB
MTAHKPGDPLTLNRLYGRSSGHKLRKGQQELVEALLPQIEVPAEGEITAQRLFGEPRPLHFEIGFGSGEHLADRADMLPDHGFVGAEPFLNGVATDDPTYLAWSLMVMQRHTAAFGWRAKGPNDFLEPSGGWIETRYGAKARREGRRPYYLRYVRV